MLGILPAPPEVVNEVFAAVDEISVGTKPFRLREIFTFTNSTLRLSESFRLVSLSSEPASYMHAEHKPQLSDKLHQQYSVKS